MSYTLTNQVEWLLNQGWDSRIHAAANGDLVTVFVLITQRYVILIDTLLNPTATIPLVEFARPYLADRQLLVINSHSDWDHAWGNQLFAGPSAHYPAPIIAHAHSTRIFDHPQTVEFLHKMQVENPKIFGDVVLTKPTITFDNNFWIDGGDLTLHLLPTPGHTSDHISIFIPEISTLLVGDAAELPFPAAENAIALPQLRASLTRLATLEATNVLYCHAPVTVGPNLIRDNIVYFDTLEAACRQALAHGLDPTQLPDHTLASALNCEFASIPRITGSWSELLQEDHLQSHIAQLKLMLTWVQGEEAIHEDR